MTLNPPTPGLKPVRVVNRTHSPIRAEVIVQSGDELEVSPDVADQLVARGGFSEVEKKPAKKATATKKAAPKKDD